MAAAANQMVRLVHTCKAKEYDTCAKEFAKSSKFVIISTLDDGNCFFDTLSKAASYYDVPRLAYTHHELRAQLVEHMLFNMDEVMSFFVMNNNGNSGNNNFNSNNNNGNGNNENNYKTPEERIISLGEDGVWDNKDGDTISQIASQAFNVNINLYDVKKQTIKKKKSVIVNKIRLHIENPTHEINILRINDGHYELLVPNKANNANRKSRKNRNAANARSTSKSRSRSRSRNGNTNMNELNGMNESTIQKSRKFTVDKLKEILGRMHLLDNDLKGMKKPELIQHYKLIRSTKKNTKKANQDTLESLMLKLSLGEELTQAQQNKLASY